MTVPTHSPVNVTYGGVKPAEGFVAGDIVLGAAADGWVFLRVLAVRLRHDVDTGELVRVELDTDVVRLRYPAGMDVMFGLEVS